MLAANAPVKVDKPKVPHQLAGMAALKNLRARKAASSSTSSLPKHKPPTTRPAASGATGHDWWHLPSDSKHASLDDVPVGVDVADEDVVSVALLVDEHVDELINATEASEPSGTQLGIFVCV